MAVETFFIISGFYMSLILNHKYNNYQLFITNRFLRIYPIYWVVLILVFLSSVISGVEQGDWISLSSCIEWCRHINITSLAFLIITNLIIFGQDLVMFLGLNVHNGVLVFTKNFRLADPLMYNFLLIPQAWTLGLELVFYLVAPFILKKPIRFVLYLMGMSLLLRFFILFILGWNYDPWTYRFFPTEFLFFLLGNMSYRIYKIINGRQKFLLVSKVVAIGFLLVFMCYSYIPVVSNLKTVIYYCFSFISLPFLFLATKDFKKDVRIGELSYPIYIVHMFVISIANLFLSRFQLRNFETLIILCVTILTAFILLKGIADPIEKFRQFRWMRQGQSEGGIDPKS